MMNTQIVSTAERTLRLIELVLAEPEGLAPLDMLEVLGTSRSSLFILLNRLKTLGYLEQAEKRGRYRAGPRLAAWHSAPNDSVQTLMNAFYQEMGRLTWPETLLLCVRAPEGVLILAQVESSQPVRSVYTLGEVSQNLSAAAEILTTEPSKSILENGYSLTQPPQLFELALPICPDGSKPQAALLLSAPAFRWTEDSLLDGCLADLRIMAARLSYRLGATSYIPYKNANAMELHPESPLSAGEIETFLQGPWTARLACIRPDGKPHVIPVWHSWDDGKFTVIAWEGSQWAGYLQENPEVSLTIDESWPPFRRVVARGTAVPMPEPVNRGAVSRLVQQMGSRYLGTAAATLKVENVLRVFTIHVKFLRGYQGLPGSGSSESQPW